MRIIVPLSQARAQREIDGKTIVEHVAGLFSGPAVFVFVTDKTSAEDAEFRALLKAAAPRCEIVGIDSVDGELWHSVFEAAPHLRDDEPVVVAGGDRTLSWNHAQFLGYVGATDCDACLPAVRDASPRLTTKGDWVRAITPPTDGAPGFSPAGIYYFKSGKLLKQYLQPSDSFERLFGALLDAYAKVRVFEIDHFICWETPTDMEEYQAWSEYFARYTAWKSRLPKQPGTLLLPLSEETAQRDLDGQPVLDRTIGSLPNLESTIALLPDDAEAAAAAASVLGKGERHATVIPHSSPTNGTAFACLASESSLDVEAPLLIAYGEGALVYDEHPLASLLRDTNVDFVVWRANGKETGTFWFRKAAYFLEGAKEIVRTNRPSDGRYSVEAVVAFLSAKGLRGRDFAVRRFISFATPADVKAYEGWANYFRRAAESAHREKRRA